MTTFARIDPATNAVRDTVELTPEQYAAFEGNPKRDYWRPLVIDAKPTPSASQRVESAGYVIEPTQVRMTWRLVDKTAAELEADANAAELGQLRALLEALRADIDAGLTAAPTTAAQAYSQIQDLKRRALRTDRVLHYMLKHQ
jgi:hypothetical protein